MSAHPEVAEFVETLAKTQALAPARLLAYQRRLLERLVRHAQRETTYYSERLRPLIGSGDAIDWDRWHEVPILRRADAQGHFEELCARTQPLAAGGSSEDTSSGSTGKPVRHLTSHIQDLASACASERFFRWHGIDPAGLTLRIRAIKHPEAKYPHGRRVHGWRAGHPESLAVDLSIATEVANQIEWLERERPKYLISYPSNLREIARYGVRTGKSLRFDGVMSFGEMISPDMRESIETYFGRPLLDRYGSSEVGQISAMCPELGRHHITSELVLMEIVSESDGRPVPPGALGSVVVTPLYNYAMPLIRYEIGDIGALATEACSCGRTLPVLDRLYGRARNIFRFVDGTSTWPVLMSRDIQGFVPNSQFQLVQLTHTQVELRYVPAAENQATDLDGLTAYLRKALHPSLSVQLCSVPVIPRSAGGKFEDFMSLVA